MNIEALLYLQGYAEKGWLRTMQDYQEWMRRYETEVRKYLEANFSPQARNAVLGQFWWEPEKGLKGDPKLGYNAVLDWAVNKEDLKYNFEKLLRHIKKKEISNINVRGNRRSGKTTTALAIAYALRDEYQCVWVAPYIDREVLPPWLDWKPNILHLRKGELGITDEAGIQFSNRRWNSRGSRSAFDLLPVIAHAGAKLITITQLTSIADINIVRWTNVDICKGFATSAFGVENIERQNILDPLDFYLNPRKNYVFQGSNEKSWSVVSLGSSKFTIYTEEPPFMTDDLSRTYKTFEERCGGDKVKAKEMAMAAMSQMIDNGCDAQMVASQLATRGYPIALEVVSRHIERYIEEQLPPELRKKKRRDEDEWS